MATEFDRQYQLLNDDQKKAVDIIEGPLLVVAGPGTGKTQLLSMRVANILLKTDASPGSVLCLTFTNKAAVNMRERLQELTGNDARRVVVRTFHSFAAEVMNIYPDYFWNGAHLAIAPDAVQLEIIESILSGLPLDNPLALKFAGKYTAVSDVQSALKLTKEAGLTPEKLESLISANLAYIDSLEEVLMDILSKPLSSKHLDKLIKQIDSLPDMPIDETVFPLVSLSTVIKESLAAAVAKDEGTGKTKYTGSWKKRWIQTIDGKKGMHDERRRNSWWLALAEVYSMYRQQLHIRGFYDYADMLVEVITQLEQHPDLLAGVQERFLYVLIDEFQDTNAAQLRLAHLTAGHHTTGGAPNLMAVGDDDQSIYKFNGAELGNMLSFRRMYPDARLIVLTKNYRSNEKVLSTAEKIIEQAEDRLVNRDPNLTKKLTAQTYRGTAGRISHLVYPSREHQLSSIARMIGEVYSKDEKIAVLARGHASLRHMAGLLVHLKVPVRYEQQSNILEHEAVKQTSYITRLVVAVSEGDKEAVNSFLAKTLPHPMWNITPKTLWKLATDNYPSGEWLNSLLKNEDKRLEDIANWLLWLANEAKYQPLSILLEYILGLRPGEHYTGPIKEYFVTSRSRAGTDYLHTLSAIQLLRTLVAEFSTNPQTNLADFVQFISLHEANERIIADESPFVTDENAVQLLTVHKAKGLEFDQVFVVDAVDKNWQPRPGGRKPPVNLPLQPMGDDEDDYVRLMYVAVTRAKHSVIVSSYFQDHAGEEVLPTPLVKNAISDETRIEQKDTSSTIAVLEESLMWPRLESGSEKAMLKARLESYSLSVTHLMNFLDLSKGGPQYFLERNLLRLPEIKTASQSLGTAVHSALETAQRLTNNGTFELSKVKQAYADALIREELPTTEAKRYTRHGKAIIQKLFEDFKYSLPRGSLPEQDIKDVSLGSATISGKLDRLDNMSEEAIIVTDYKTGRPLRSFTTKDQAEVLRAWRHRTQLIFYALLVRHSVRFKGHKNVKGQMVYIEATTSKELIRSYNPSDEEIAHLEKLIMAIWPKIINITFPQTNHYSPDMQGILQFEDDLINDRI